MIARPTLARRLLPALLAILLSGCAAQMAYREGNELVAQDKVEAGLSKYQEALAADPANVQYKTGGQSVVNVGYRYQRDVLSQAELSSSWPVSDAWNVFVRGIYSLRDHKPLERFAGFEYRACCWKVRLGGRSFVSNRTGSSDTGVYLQLELTGLASVGSASDSFLTTAIRGYEPAENSIRQPQPPSGPR